MADRRLILLIGAFSASVIVLFIIRYWLFSASLFFTPRLPLFRTPDSYVLGASGRRFSGEKIRTASSELLLGGKEANLPVLGKDLSIENGCTCTHGRWAVVTTVNEPSPAVQRVHESDEWCLVVVGDAKTPLVSWKNIANSKTCTTVLDLGLQKRYFPRIAALIPENHFGRKNIGYLYALRQSAKMIWDFDDDNDGLPPLVDFTAPIAASKPRIVDPSGALNPYPYFGSTESRVWPRGLPLQRIHATNTKRVLYDVTEISISNVGVVQYLANHDPDVDAVFRLTRTGQFNWKATAETHRPWLLPAGRYAPFNAQASLWCSPATFRNMLLPITVHGRASDIWRSYIAERMFPRQMRVLYAPPVVVQTRNDHDNIKDMDAEHALYHQSEQLVNFLARNRFPSSLALTKALYERGYLGAGDIALRQAWDAAVDAMMMP